MTDLQGKRVQVAGGEGFLGTHLVKELRQRNPAENLIPCSADYDLTEQAQVRNVYRCARPDVVIHAAAEVGGIGVNRANLGRYFYANAMGLHLVEAALEHKVEKFVQLVTVCACPKHTPVPSGEALWDGYPEETDAPSGIVKKSLLVMLDGYRSQYGLKSIYLLPVNLYGPGDNFDIQTSHVIPALIRTFVEAKDTSAPFVEAWGTGSASREFPSPTLHRPLSSPQSDTTVTTLSISAQDTK